jgi:RHS repeat-associated protein
MAGSFVITITQEARETLNFGLITPQENLNKVVFELRYREASRAVLWRVDKACPLRCPAGVLREGEVRATWTSSPSTTPAYKMPLYTYTGQAADLDDPTTSGVTEGFGLMFYNARWYDPYLNHFVQADTIIPGGVQGLDRYAAMNNNPIRYNDPSGHMIDDGCNTDGCEGENQTLPPPGVSQQRHESLRALQEEAELMSTLVHSGAITDVEALARILDFAALMYGSNIKGFLTDLGLVIGGLDGTTVVSQGDPMSQYYVGYDAFDPGAGTTGFNIAYNPNDDNQVRHFLAGASASENYGALIEKYLLAQEQSPEDDALYGQAFAFVDYLNSGVPLSDAGNWVLNNLR